MKFLSVFEQRIGGLFGATADGQTAPFSFKRLAKRAVHEMESETYVIDGVDTAPALYTVLISTKDDLAMRPLYADLTREVSNFIEAQAKQKRYSFVGTPLVRFMADPSLKSGRFSVFAENVDVQTLKRLRREEAKFMGADPDGPNANGATPRSRESRRRRARRARRPETSPAILPTSDPPTHLPSPTPSSVSSDIDAGLDVLPQETVLAAEEAALGRATHGRGSSRPRPAAHAAPPTSLDQGTSTGRGTVAPLPVTSPSGGRHHSQPPSIAPDDRTGDEYAAHRPLRVPATPHSAAPDALPTCRLIDRQNGRTYVATAPKAAIGREHALDDIVLSDPNVSRTHAELSYDGRGWRIRDLNSTNGTLVNDVDVDECPLRDGDLITFGLVNLEFREN